MSSPDLIRPSNPVYSTQQSQFYVFSFTNAIVPDFSPCMVGPKRIAVVEKEIGY